MARLLLLATTIALVSYANRSMSELGPIGQPTDSASFLFFCSRSVSLSYFPYSFARVLHPLGHFLLPASTVEHVFASVAASFEAIVSIIRFRFVSWPIRNPS